MNEASVAATRQYLLSLQDNICAALEEVDGAQPFREDHWQRPGGGGGRSRVLSEGGVFEKAGVGFSHVSGDALPPSATAQRPELAGDRKSTRLNSSHVTISYAVFCLKKKKIRGEA